MLDANVGSRIVFALFEAEQTRGTDGAVFIEEDDTVVFRRLHELDDAATRDAIEDALTDDVNHALVVDARSEPRRLWSVPKRLFASMMGTSAVLLGAERAMPIWETMQKAGSSSLLPPPSQ